MRLAGAERNNGRHKNRSGVGVVARVVGVVEVTADERCRVPDPISPIRLARLATDQ